MKQSVLLFLEKVEECLLKSNVHVDIVEKIINTVARKIVKNKNTTKEEVLEMVSNKIKTMMKRHIKDFDIDQENKPYVMLVCGVNGSGKTTTVGKMAVLLKKYGWNLMIAECDNYNESAKSQLRDIVDLDEDDFIFASSLSDTPAKVAIKAYKNAVKKNKDILLIDTSGRFQKNKALMDELQKVKKELYKITNNTLNDVVLVIDSTCGYNALKQAKIYDEIIGITGIIATKIDIAKRPGIILSVCEKLNMKIFGVCNGEKNDEINDLDLDKFTNAILQDVINVL